MKKTVSYSAFERISSKMAKEFGTIKKGKEDEYAFCMLPIEGNLLKINRKYHVNNGRRAIEAIRICFHIIDGYINNMEYDLSEYISDKNKEFLTGVLMGVDPFTNKEIYKAVKSIYDLDSADGLREYFALPVKCLLRVEASIQFWTDRYGVSGYFDFIEDQMGRILEDNEKMDFVLEVKR